MDIKPLKRRKLNDFELVRGSHDIDRSDSRDGSIDSESSVTPLLSGPSRNNGRRSRNIGQIRQDMLRISGVPSHHVDLLGLQIRELLAKLTPKYENSMVHMEAAIHKLRDAIEGIPPREGLPVC